jgi:hypothetical protein
MRRESLLSVLVAAEQHRGANGTCSYQSFRYRQAVHRSGGDVEHPTVEWPVAAGSVRLLATARDPDGVAVARQRSRDAVGDAGVLLYQ